MGALDEWGGGSSSSSGSSSDSSSGSSSSSSSCSSSSDEDTDADHNLKISSQPVQQPQRQQEQQQQQFKPNNPFAAAAGFKNIFASATPPASAAAVSGALPVSDPLKVVPGAGHLLVFCFILAKSPPHCDKCACFTGWFLLHDIQLKIGCNSEQHRRRRGLCWSMGRGRFRCASGLMFAVAVCSRFLV